MTASNLSVPALDATTWRFIGEPEQVKIRIADIGPVEGIALWYHYDAVVLRISSEGLHHLFPDAGDPPEQQQSDLQSRETWVPRIGGLVRSCRITLIHEVGTNRFVLRPDSAGHVLHWTGYRHGVANHPQAGASVTLRDVDIDQHLPATYKHQSTETIEMPAEKGREGDTPILRFSVPVSRASVEPHADIRVPPPNFDDLAPPRRSVVGRVLDFVGTALAVAFVAAVVVIAYELRRLVG
jgi:hypothetical protein